MKPRIIYALVAIIIIIISIFGVRQYLENERYENFLSRQVANDIGRLTGAVRVNETIYDEISSSRSLSLEQVETLFHNNHSIVNIAQEHKNLVLQFKRSGQELDNIPANKASDIAYYFKRLIWDIAERQGIDVSNKTTQFPIHLSKSKPYPIKDKELKKIRIIKGLNNTWSQVISNNVKCVSDEGIMNSDIFFDEYVDKGITSDYWVNVAVEMEKRTDKYLDKNYLLLN
ncbi:hypothetical protein BN1058_02599 [Paraliobacillus sp. PM-2]|uniref:hypothetical protein n=1 Tax=Paraliobacillus sp. PM-2 TaxID=1462524 RepID=UPI00061C65E5|nr:hypothetical protein [Paraliobacillus sp. PM-2]CQR48245.1 hypothetical protein BN1058_02599 [Paraliobacillus sp. PM-2]